jgi:hypothetical protein
MEGGILAQIEDVGLAVVARFPAFGEFRRDDLGVKEIVPSARVFSP